MLFLFANIKSTDAGVGYQYLASSLFCIAVVGVLKVGSLNTILIRRSCFFLTGFLAYFFIKAIIDIPEFSEIKARTIGTSGGLVFAFLLGTTVSMLVSILFEAETRKHVRASLVLSILLLILVLAFDSFRNHSSNIRTDLFLVDSESRTYQRPGSFIVIAALISSFLFSQSSRKPKSRANLFRAVYIANFLVYSITIVILMLTSQLIGSNTGFVVPLFLGVGTFVWLWRPDLSHVQHASNILQKYFGPYVAFRKYLPRLFGAGLFVALGIVGVVIVTFAMTSLEPQQFRIFGFSEGTLGGNSLTSRFSLLVENFPTQVAYSPIFGNLRVDELTTGSGSYAHSLISIISHLGVVGGALFVSYVTLLLREIRTSNIRISSCYGEIDVRVLRLIYIGIILTFAAVATFFTWMPLWFALGLLFPPVHLERARFRAACPTVAGLYRAYLWRKNRSLEPILRRRTP